MEDLCKLAQLHADDLTIHAVSLAVLARALNDAWESANGPDRVTLHRAADLALAIFGQEKRRFESIDCCAPLLDTLYLKAFLPGDEPEEAQAEEAQIGERFHSEVLRLLRPLTTATGNAPVGRPQSR